MKWFQDAGISKKLMSCFLALALLSAVIGAVGIFSVFSMKQVDSILYEQDTVGLEYAGQAGTTFQQIRYYALALAYLGASDQVNLQKNLESLETNSAELEAALTAAEAAITDKETLELLADVRADWSAYQSILNEQNEARLSGTAVGIDPTLVSTGVSLRDNFLKLFDLIAESAHARADDNARLATVAMVLMAAVAGIAVAAAVILALLLTKSIGAPLETVTKIAEMMAVGNLKVNTVLTDKDREMVKRKDEIGKLNLAFMQLVNSTGDQIKQTRQIADGDLTTEIVMRSDKDYMGRELTSLVDGLNRLARSIVTAADQVAAGSAQVSNSSMALSQGATEQASAVEELTASLETIADQTGLNARNAQKANELSGAAKEGAAAGTLQMHEMLRAMEEISAASGSIGKIVKTIDDIAFQTNILALNAAVEAARAGQHGRGFAVVAQEVRTLAAKSAEAAKETTDMIEGTIRKVSAGTGIAQDTAKALDRIVTNVDQAADLVSAIASASREQAQGLDQIRQGVEQVSQVVQANAAASEESAAASQELSGQAAQLKASAGVFKLRGAAPSPAAQTPSGALPKAEAQPPEAPMPTTSERPAIDLSGSFGKY